MKGPDVRIRLVGVPEAELRLELLLRLRARAERMAEEARRELDRTLQTLRRLEQELTRRGS